MTLDSLIHAIVAAMKTRRAEPIAKPLNRIWPELTAYNETPASPPAQDSALREALHLTEYEIQVLLGTSIHGCNMAPDRTFSLPMAWHRLHALGLIDRTDGLAIITEKGREIVSSILAALKAHSTELADAKAERAIKEGR